MWYGCTVFCFWCVMIQYLFFQAPLCKNPPQKMEGGNLKYYNREEKNLILSFYITRALKNHTLCFLACKSDYCYYFEDMVRYYMSVFTCIITHMSRFISEYIYMCVCVYKYKNTRLWGDRVGGVKWKKTGMIPKVKIKF